MVLRPEGLDVQLIFAMSDALWARVTAILAESDPAAPPNARALLNAIIYRALAGTSWYELPAAYPPPADVVAWGEQWRQRGVLERLEAMLLVRLDV